MRSAFRRLFLSAASVVALAGTAAGDPLIFTPEPFDEAFFGFAARSQIDMLPLAGFEDNYIVGGGYQRLWGDPNGFRYGGEVGLAGRFGEVNSLEAWAGFVARYEFTFFDMFRLSPAMSIGLSAVTAPMAGIETQRMIERGGDPTLLFYLGPELNISLVDYPNVELFIRNHHRSGAWGTLGNTVGSADSTAIGLRWHF